MVTSKGKILHPRTSKNDLLEYMNLTIYLSSTIYRERKESLTFRTPSLGTQTSNPVFSIVDFKQVNTVWEPVTDFVWIRTSY